MKDLRAALGAPDDELLPAAPILAFHNALSGQAHLGTLEGCTMCATHAESAAAAEPLPDLDADDCPVWLPQDPTVPHKDRTPCCLDHLHAGDHVPTDPDALLRARRGVLIDKRDEHVNREWVRVSFAAAPPLGQSVTGDLDLLRIAAELGRAFGFELISDLVVEKVR